MSNYIQGLRRRGFKEDMDILTRFAELGYAFSRLPMDGRNIQFCSSDDKHYIRVENLRGGFTSAIGSDIINAIENVAGSIDHSCNEEDYVGFKKRMEVLNEPG